MVLANVARLQSKREEERFSKLLALALVAGCIPETETKKDIWTNCAIQLIVPPFESWSRSQKPENFHFRHWNVFIKIHPQRRFQKGVFNFIKRSFMDASILNGKFVTWRELQLAFIESYLTCCRHWSRNACLFGWFLNVCILIAKEWRNGGKDWGEFVTSKVSDQKANQHSKWRRTCTSPSFKYI